MRSSAEGILLQEEHAAMHVEYSMLLVRRGSAEEEDEGWRMAAITRAENT